MSRQEIAEVAKMQDLHRHPAVIDVQDHGNDPDCMGRTHAALLSLDPGILEELKTLQAQLGYSTANWPDPVTD